MTSRPAPWFCAIAAAASLALAATTDPARATGFTDIALMPLTIPAVRTDARADATGLVQSVHAQALRPAPLPDPDAAPPGPSNETLAAQQDPSLGPGFFNPQNHFAGDGYAPGSSIENDKNHRHTPGGGMALSIPMQ